MAVWLPEGELKLGELLGPTVAELLDSGQADQAEEAMAHLREPERADLLENLQPTQATEALRLIPEERRGATFRRLSVGQQIALLDRLSDEEVATLYAAMEPDDRVSVLHSLPEETARRCIRVLPPAIDRETRSLLEYPEESVGRLMTNAFLVVAGEWTAGRVLAHIRERGRHAETLDTLYVTDRAGRLVAEVSLRAVLLAHPDEAVSALAEPHPIALRAEDDREEAVRQMQRHDRPVLPVLDRADRLIGIVTFDDVADVAREEATEDIQKLGGVEALETPYMSTHLVKLLRKRVGWLLVLYGGGLLTTLAMSGFQEQIESYAVLAIFVPLIIASGGNSGAQAATLLIRALAVGEVRRRDWLRVLGRELLSGLMLGATLGLLGLLTVVVGQAGIGAWGGSDAGGVWQTGLVIGVALVGVVTIGTLVGGLLPIILQTAGMDPATGSTPFVATLVDVMGLLIYFTCATVILGS